MECKTRPIQLGTLVGSGAGTRLGCGQGTAEACWPCASDEPLETVFVALPRKSYQRSSQHDRRDGTATRPDITFAQSAVETRYDDKVCMMNSDANAKVTLPLPPIPTPSPPPGPLRTARARPWA